ncbi:hypothetical protein C5708_03115 [Caulobacter sp. CCUG 60055]|nr:hypothetical protein [Caulobacter sp. CCUG 60055]
MRRRRLTLQAAVFLAEVMLNRDDRVWIDRFDSGLVDAGLTRSAADGERIPRLVAHHVGGEVHADRPRLAAELPGTGERFEGLLPPTVAAPTFSLRKLAGRVFTLADYVQAGVTAIASARPRSERPRPPALFGNVGDEVPDGGEEASAHEAAEGGQSHQGQGAAQIERRDRELNGQEMEAEDQVEQRLGPTDRHHQRPCQMAEPDEEGQRPASGKEADAHEKLPVC